MGHGQSLRSHTYINRPIVVYFNMFLYVKAVCSRFLKEKHEGTYKKIFLNISLKILLRANEASAQNFLTLAFRNVQIDEMSPQRDQRENSKLSQ